MKVLLKNIILFFIYGILYYAIEIAYRGWSDWRMIIVGGICAICTGKLNECIDWSVSFWKQVLYGEIIVLLVEFISGCILNIGLRLNIWDYSSLPFNIYGQICLPFAILWIPLIIGVIILDDYLRYWWFKEEKPNYKLF